MTPPSVDLELYRPNAGVVLFNTQGLCWLGRRKGAEPPWVWQWPQGGMDEGEDGETAALRELYEETGIQPAQVELLGSTPDWLTYDFPPEVLARQKKNWAGQKQLWFGYRFLGTDADFDLTAVPPQEFDAFRWAGLDEAVDSVIPWKRGVYRAVAETFRAFEVPT
ncbi:RNA pyrophosphohydrolase [Marinicauda pacifica]|uniref:RNA pyrophosphohydrolase n=1 Tax=Marinicauda pacifica TaxID=1133559 RepID=A0A4S2H9L0_9PROT|nr:RNA pyrophosphohydrolase [Marinicauda pacifica]TGY92298.1 RNA pyrophosphohydrolase [Marinicauda pacifica]GGE47725.1 RNA pyrophosphohydrolase [Marinicauda pacifica]